MFDSLQRIHSLLPLALTHLGQWNGQTSDTASTIADTLSGNISIVRNPVQNLLDGLVVTRSDVQLHRVDLVAVGIDFVPSVEPLRVEIFADLGLVVDGGSQGGSCSGRSGIRDRDKGRGNVCGYVEKRKDGTGGLHGGNFAGADGIDV